MVTVYQEFPKNCKNLSFFSPKITFKSKLTFEFNINVSNLEFRFTVLLPINLSQKRKTNRATIKIMVHVP